jgi:hypothetical protein
MTAISALIATVLTVCFLVMLACGVAFGIISRQIRRDLKLALELLKELREDAP